MSGRAPSAARPLATRDTMDYQEDRALRPTRAGEYDLFHKILDLLNVFLCMYFSQEILQNPVFGGALFLSGQCWIIYARLFGRRAITRLPLLSRSIAVILLACSLLLSAALLFFYPRLPSSGAAMLVILSIATVVARSIVTDVLSYRLAVHHLLRALILALTHAAFLLLLGWFVYAHSDTLGLQVFFSAHMVLGIVLFVRQLLNPLAVPQGASLRQLVGLTRLMRIGAYRIYSRMILMSYLALYTTVLMYIAHVFYARDSVLNSLWFAALWAVVSASMTYFLHRNFAVSGTRRLEKTTVFAFGVVCWILASIIQYQSAPGASVPFSIFWMVLWALGVGLTFPVLLSMNEEMKHVVELDTDKTSGSLLQESTRMLENYALLIATFLALCTLLLPGFVMDVSPAAESDAVQLYFRLGMTLFPLPFLVACLLYAIRQPLNRRYVEKLGKYRREKQAGHINPMLEMRLRAVLVQRYTKRIGVWIIAALLRPLYRHHCMNADVVNTGKGPAVFVCNHGEFYGPIVTTLYVPYPFRPWIASDLLDVKKFIPNVYNGAALTVKWIPRFLHMPIVKILAPFISWVLRSVEPIPVNRDNARSIMDTMNKSVEVLESDDNILLFPEDPSAETGGKYRNDDVGSAFFTGFIFLGKAYYKKTGKRLTFYPLFADKEKRTITFGRGVTYDPDNDIQQEKTRLIEFLRGAMRRFAQGLPQDEAPHGERRDFP